MRQFLIGNTQSADKTRFTSFSMIFCAETKVSIRARRPVRARSAGKDAAKVIVYKLEDWESTTQMLALLVCSPRT